MIPELRTNRLILTPVQLGDAEQVQQLFPQWDVVEYLNASVPWPYPADGVLRYYRDVCFPAIEAGNEWHWTLRLKQAPGQIIGAIGLNKSEWINRGFWIGSAWRGQGLMTEAVAATNDFWFDVLGFDKLGAPKAIANVASRRISEKTGMRIVAVTEHEYVSGRHATEIWEITAEEWRLHRSRPSTT